MKADNTTFSYIFVYCLVLWLTNWSLNHEYSRTVGITSSGLDARGLGALVGLVATVVLARRVWRVSRILLAAGVRVPMSIRLWGSWSCLWLLVPLAFGVTHHSSGTAHDGASVHTIFKYGGGLSWASILFSAIAIMLFQLLVRLEAFNPENQKAEQDDGRQPSIRRVGEFYES